MTAMSCSLSAPDRTEQVAVLPIMPVLLVALVGIFAVSLPNIVDPMMGYDDYPALMAQPEWFWNKTLHEGRWVNYLWHLRGLVTPSWLNFAVYQVIWASLAAALAVLAMGNADKTTNNRWFASVLALFIVIAPPATFMAQWFNTLIPGLATVAVYAVLGCRMSQRRHRLLLLPFTIVTLMAYTTYPLILLAVCIVRTEDRSLRDLAGLLGLFIISYAAAVLFIYAINWQVHGVFGIPLADWREAHPATGLSGLSANLPMLAQTFWALMTLFTYNFEPALGFHLVIMLAATLYLIRVAPKEALYLHAGLWIGMALMSVQVLKLGVTIPSRSFAFAWIFYAIIVMRAVTLLSRKPMWAGRLARNVAVLTLFAYLMQTFLYFSLSRPWQSETRSLAQDMANSQGTVLVHGDVMDLESAQAITLFDEMALSFRIEYLTGRQTVFCDDDPSNCAAVEAAAVKSNSPPPLVVKVADADGKMRLTYSIP